MKKIKLMIYISACFLLAACEQIIEVDLPEHQSRLVVNSILNPDSVFTFRLSQSKGIVDPFGPFASINSGVIKIYEDDQLIEELTSGTEGIYKTQFLKPSTQKSYKIEVSANGLPSVSSFETIPHKVRISKLVLDTLHPVVRDDMNYFPMYISFNDPEAVENFYYLEALSEMTIKQSYEDTIVSRDVYNYVMLLSDDPLVQQESSFVDNGLAFTDITFDGQEYTLKVFVNLNFYKNNYPGSDFEYKNNLIVSLKRLSSSYYRYFKTKSTQRDTDGNPLAEPVPVFNNIENGYGIFGSFTHHYLILENLK